MYAARNDMTKRFGEEELILLTDRDGSTGVIDDTVLNQALADASAEVDGYLGGRYTLPLPSVPDVLVRICCDVARYLLHDEHAPERIEKRYDNAIDFLSKLGTGKISLGMPDEGDASPSNNTAQMCSDGRVFGRKNSKGFI
ncbi:phage protein Gp36 family protein [uncultured Amphritea sp.]|uniref:gp436 family protein n=1 Tax=uncultured Amphritea sp. TaxID=981605 RepID=UPI002617D944|nr:phage protein Gp36 family protein [uncultured Amphritea sp.]